MDPTTIATLATNVVAVLTPYLAKAGEEFAKEVGKAAVGKIGALYQALRARFQSHPAAAEALANVEAAPNDEGARSALIHQLREQMTADPALADTLRQLIEEIKHDKQAATFLTQVFGGEVGEIINIDKLEGGLTINKER